ncbi:MAG TPA: hypothetical protein VMV34_10185 [Terriglobia bacterium]|nr:hypothetical protein [Terriglobia bacterium]
MTIGISLLCESGNTLLLGADARASYAGTQPLPRPHDDMCKIFTLPLGFQAVIAGYFDACEAVIASLTEAFRRVKQELQGKEVGLDHLRFAVTEAEAHEWQIILDREFQKHLGIRHRDWTTGPLDTRLVRAGKRIVQQTNFPVHLIITGFTSYEPIIFTVSGLDTISFPQKFAVIGSGFTLATNALNQRQQYEHMTFQRSVFHLIEALEAARQEPQGTVGPPRDIVVIERGAYRSLPVQDPVVRQLLSQYQGKDSKDLDNDNAIRQKLQSILYANPLDESNRGPSPGGVIPSS